MSAFHPLRTSRHNGSIRRNASAEDGLAKVVTKQAVRQREASASSNKTAELPHPASHPWRRWFAELVVIFLGVFLAALADDWRERRNEAQTAQRLAQGLRSSFEDLRRVDKSGYVEFVAKARRFEMEVAAGKRPPYHFDRARYTQRPPTGIWEAFMAADGAKLFPPELVFDLARFYNSFNNYADRVQAYYRFVEDEVLPTTGDPFAAYVPGTTTLRPRWREQHQRRKELAEALHRLTQRADELERRISAAAR